MPSSQWCKSIAICPRESHVAVGFENATVRFFKTTTFEPQREFRLHNRYHTPSECEKCPPVDTLSFSPDGETLIASTRNAKGVIQTFLRRASTFTFQELSNCHYPIPLHESEDGGISSVLYRPGVGGEDDLVCITTWTQSGTPLLVSPKTGHRVEIKADGSGHGRRLGNRIQCGTFSLTGKQLGMVNDKGHLYLVTNLNSSVMEARRLATTKELTARCSFFAMSFMVLQGDESIVLAWADVNKSVGYIRRIPIPFTVRIHAQPRLLPVVILTYVVQHGESTVADTALAHHQDVTELPGDISGGTYSSFTDRSGDTYQNATQLPSRPAARYRTVSSRPVELPATDGLRSLSLKTQ